MRISPCFSSCPYRLQLTHCFIILAHHRHPEVVIIVPVDGVLSCFLWDLRLDVLLVVLAVVFHSLSGCKHVLSKAFEIECSISNVIIATEYISVIDLKSQTVVSSGELDSELLAPVE